MFFVLVFIYFNVIYCYKANQIYLTTIKSRFHYITEPYKVSTSIPLLIRLEYCFVKEITCYSYTYGNKFCKHTNRYGRPYTFSNCEFQIPVTDEMSDTWMCIIKQFDTSDDTYLYLNVEVQDAKPPQKVLVNRVIQPTRKSKPGSYIATYEYVEEDKIDFNCISPHTDCSVRLEYDHSGPLLEVFKNFSSNTNLGFRTTLQTEHNNSHVICKCQCMEHEVEIVLTFKLKEKLDAITNVQINGLSVRGTRQLLKYDKYNTFFLNYGYLPEESIKTECYTENTDLVISSEYYESTGVKTIGQNEVSLKSKLYTKVIYHALQGEINSSEKPSIEEAVVITFTRLNLNDYNPLSINLPETNILMEFYQYEYNTRRKMYYIYEYYDGDDLLLNCSRYLDLLNKFTTEEQYVDFNGTALEIKRSVSKLITLTPSHNNTNYKCVLKNGYYNDTSPNDSVVSQINIFFVMKSPSEIDETYQALVLVTVIVVICLIVICIATVLFMRKRKLQQQDQEYKFNSQPNTRNIIPPNSTQCHIDPVLPNNQIRNRLASYLEKTLYSKVIPKSQRKVNDSKYIYENKTFEEKTGVNLDNLYADIDLTEVKDCRRVISGRNDESGREIYAQVVPEYDRNDNIYGNVFINTKKGIIAEGDYVN